MRDLTPEPPVAPNTWTEYKMVRRGLHTTVSTTELIDDVLYLATITYGADNRMETKTLTRADLVSAGARKG